MKPVKLEFKGLNSFSERAVIDFTPLLQSGIFGIFGETGSGKSTILDAINFALYGDIERNPDKIDKINYRCDELEVKFTFDIFTEGARRKYLVERSIKRKSGTHKALLYEFSEDGKSVAIADNVKSVNDRITDIIGINKEDFRKCIALPQGEFAQFVNSAPAERIELIERLFSLQKYGKALKAKLSAKESAVLNEYANIEGALSVYGSDTREKLDELKEKISSLESVEAGLEKAAAEAEEQYNLLNKLFEQKTAYAAAVVRLEKLKAGKAEYDELGRVLPVLAVCERACAESDEAERCSVRLRELDISDKKLQDEIENIKIKAADLEGQLKGGKLDELCEKLQREYALMEGMQSAVSALSSQSTELELCRSQYKRVCAERISFSEQFKDKSAELSVLRKKLEGMPEPDIDEYFKKEFRGGILKEEYARTLGYIKELQGELRQYNDNSALYDFIQRELNSKGEEYKQLILAVKDAKIDVNGELADFRRALDERKKLELSLNKADGDIAAIKIKLKNSEEKVSELEERGKKLAAVCRELENRVTEVFGVKDAEACRKKYSQTAAELSSARGRREELNSRAEKLQRNLSENESLLAANRARAATLAEQRQAAEKAAEEFVASAGMNCVAECRALLKRYTSYEKALRDYNDFIAEYSKAEGEAKSAKPAAETEDITAESVSAAFEAKEKARAAHAENRSELAVLKSASAELAGRLESKAALEKKFANVKNERDLIGKLKSLLRDNKFMEFIANEHLVNISRAASRTLIELTDGRYYLSYVDNNFCVGDNYNGGELRKVKTLSGGETFLVSLSLALALSSTICSRSLKSIEFFFLDEGFGTLDGDLIDTVLEALEKLKNENFSIGLISHVEELKHRINSKILVSKATESHGSTIKISC